MGDEDVRRSRKRTARLDEPTARIVTTPSQREHVTLSVLAGGSAGALYVLGTETISIGRDADNAVVLSDVGVSGHHARIVRKRGRFILEDLGSTNGTFVNGHPITTPTELSDGDRIDLGQASVLGVRYQDAVELEAAQKLYESVVRDPLTGLYNRRHFQERLNAEWAYAVRHRASIALVMMDIDHFKRVNDTYGHLGGDEVLRVIGAAVTAQIRAEDIAARFGGEEFIVLSRGLDLAQAVAFAERLRRGIAATKPRFQSTTIPVTASFGVAVMPADQPIADSAALVARADAALYRAKHEGRNRVCADG